MNILLTNLLWAQEPGVPAAAGSPLQGMMPIFLIFIVFYFLLIRPQKKQATEHKNMLTKLTRNDEIVTTGGLHGKIISLKGQELEVEIAPNVRVTVSRQSVANLKTRTQIEETTGKDKQ